MPDPIEALPGEDAAQALMRHLQLGDSPHMYLLSKGWEFSSRSDSFGYFHPKHGTKWLPEDAIVYQQELEGRDVSDLVAEPLIGRDA